MSINDRELTAAEILAMAMPKTYTADEMKRECRHRYDDSLARGCNPIRAMAEVAEWRKQFKPTKKP